MSPADPVQPNLKKPQAPATARVTPPRAPATPPTDAELLASITGSVPPAETPGAYALGIALLVAALVLLPLAYLALVAFVGYLILSHLLDALRGFSTSGGPLLVALIPSALGALVLLFLVKPLFVRPKRTEDEVVALAPADDPLLFAFVERLCAAVGAPRPAMIEVDCEANAGARFRRGILSMAGDDLVVRIGLPLAEALTVQEFAGVLAHELGHFGQRGGMRGTYLVRLINRWLARVVFQRDRFDARLERWRRHRDGWKRIAYWPCVGLVESARGVLWLLLVGGEALSAGALRRMEFDADRVEAHVAGSAGFDRTSRAISYLSLAARAARSDISRSWEQRRLADDLPRLIVANGRDLPPEVRQKLREYLETSKTGIFDTHPSHAARVEHVAALAAPGFVRCAHPARVLFRNVRGLSRRATEAFYRRALEGEYSPAGLVPTTSFVADVRAEREARRALRGFYRGDLLWQRPVLPDPASLRAAPPANVSAAVAELRQLRDQMVAEAPTAARAVRTYTKADQDLVSARVQAQLAALFSRMAAFRRRKEHEVNRLQYEVNQATLELGGFEDAARHRLTLALRLLRHDAVGVRMPLGDARAPRATVARLATVAEALEACIPAAQACRTACGTLFLMIRVLHAQPNRTLVAYILEQSRDVQARLSTLQASLAHVPYPFEHAERKISVAAAVVGVVPPSQQPIDMVLTGLSALNRFYTLVYRTAADLALVAEQVERAVGIAPLPDPEADPATDEKKASEPDDEDVEAKRQTRAYRIWYPVRAAAGLTMLAVLIWLTATSAAPTSSSQARFGRRPINPAPYAPVSPSMPPAPPPAPPVPSPSVPAVQPLTEDARLSVVTQTRFRLIHFALEQYRITHRGSYPSSLESLVSLGSLSSTSLVSSVDDRTPYVYLPPRPNAPPDDILVYDRLSLPRLGSAHLCVDGSIQQRVDPARRQRLLSRQQSSH